MNYDELTTYLESNFLRSGAPTLARMRALLAALDNPQDKLRCIHIAGTNGKGSTAAMLSSILTEAHKKTGCLTSPHLYTMRERIAVNGAPIQEDWFVRVGEVVLSQAKALEQKGAEPFLMVEILTAMALLCFYHVGVDFAVLETGLGGRFDSTNVVTPVVSVLTAIGYDHMELLGNTIEEIAFEKAGIIKAQVPVVLYPQRSPEAAQMLRTVAAERHSPVVSVKLEEIEGIGWTADFKQKIHCAWQKEGEYYTLNLLGPHQRYNAATVLATVSELRRQGVSIPEESVRRGLDRVVWSGRCSVVGTRPLFVIDGAHNRDSIDALAETFQTTFSKKKIVGIAGMLADKDYFYGAKTLGPLLESCLTLTPDNPRALSAAALASAFGPYCPAKPAITMDQAIAAAKYRAGEEGMVCVFGSLHLAGAVYHKLTGCRID